MKNPYPYSTNSYSADLVETMEADADLLLWEEDFEEDFEDLELSEEEIKIIAYQTQMDRDTSHTFDQHSEG